MLLHRGIDFADAAGVFAGPTYDFADIRRDYGEQRMISIGFLNNQMRPLQKGSFREALSKSLW